MSKQMVFDIVLVDSNRKLSTASTTASAQPIQGSLVTVLEQALKSNDNDQSSWVMQQTDQGLI